MDAGPSTHPTPETLQAYGLGKLDDASAEVVSKHLEDCPDCRRQVTETGALRFGSACCVHRLEQRPLTMPSLNLRRLRVCPPRVKSTRRPMLGATLMMQAFRPALASATSATTSC